MMSANPKKPVVLHVITGMGLGGAESMLLKMLRSSTLQATDQVVVSLLPGGSLKPQMIDAAAELHELNLFGPVGLPSGLLRLGHIAREIRPDVIQGWMYHGNLGAWVAHRSVADESALLWGVRQSLPSLAPENAFARFAIRAGRIFSAKPDRVIFNSVKSIDDHVAFGFHRSNIGYIPNGFDLDQFVPDSSARHRLRSQWGVQDDEVVFALVARFHPFKNHQGFIQACAQVLSQFNNIKVLLAGTGTGEGNQALDALIHTTGINDRVIRLGERTDMPAVMSAIDVKVLPSSHVEGFPNALGEALCTGVPCIATDAGDSSAVIGDCGIVVPKNNHQALVEAMLKMVEIGPHGRERLGQAGRQRMQSKYGLESVARQYLDLYVELMSQRRPYSPQRLQKAR